MWRVIVPVWGAEYVNTFITRALPALERAIKRARLPVQVWLFTDDPDDLIKSSVIDIVKSPVPGGSGPFDKLSTAHRIGLGQPRGEHVMLLTADLLVSEEMFEYCEWALSNYRVVAVPGIRADIAAKNEPTHNARLLLEWAWANRHPLTSESIWPNGHISDMSRLYFEHGPNVITRMGLPHPIALMIDGRPLSFRPTIDADLIANFHPTEIQMVAEPVVALVELSPQDKTFGISKQTMRERVLNGDVLISQRADVQRWLWQQRVVLCGGQDDVGDDAVIDVILRDHAARVPPGHRVNHY